MSIANSNTDTIDDLEQYLEEAKKLFNLRYGRHVDYSVELSNFERIAVLGAGSFGRVYLVRMIETDKYHAMKILNKERIIRLKQRSHTLNEKRILEAIDFPFVVKMDYFIMDNSYIYFVLPFISGGELFNLLRKFHFFSEDQARFYAAQVLLGLEYLHHMDLIYRDLKPENILLNNIGYIRITDFGFCKLVKGRSWTLCGTPDYIAPEIILSRGYGKGVDYWAFGVLIYEMCVGYPPFVAKDPIKLYEKIVVGKYRNATHFSDDIKDIIKKLLELDTTKRFGNLANGVIDIKEHRWFRKIDWLGILNYQIPAPYIPTVRRPEEISSSSITDDELKISETDEFKDQFEDF